MTRAALVIGGPPRGITDAEDERKKGDGIRDCVAPSNEQNGVWKVRQTMCESLI
ncbi:hypothetical protein SAMD00023353_2500370 [Rosellinia necatrix]|uniref:Uncharacterized protein n=1 Tax=Rosellinia necatrix TaxID=77044 RepID=A0A1S8A8D8_ROSNE|nr:hypothetical protein SAMD00023353_2500370 [Rosellinia necatrix]